MLSKRERTIAIVTGTALGLAALSYGYDWVQGQFDDLAQQKVKLSKARADAAATLKRNEAATRQWKDFAKSGLMRDATSSESGLLEAIGARAQEARLPLTSERTDRASVSHGLHDLAFEVTADGSMRAIANFIYRLETTAMPVRVRELQISTKKEGTDDLSMQLRLSTLWDDPKAQLEKPPAPKEAQQ